MRAVIISLALACLASGATAGDHYVAGHVTRDGTYVAPHYATDPNATRNDNYSTRGNVNPYTGQAGTKPRDEDAYGSRATTQPAWGTSSYGTPSTGSSWGTSSHGTKQPSNSAYGDGDPN